MNYTEEEEDSMKTSTYAVFTFRQSIGINTHGQGEQRMC